MAEKHSFQHTSLLADSYYSISYPLPFPVKCISPVLHSQEGASHPSYTVRKREVTPLTQSRRDKSPLLHSQEGTSHPSYTVRKREVTPLTQSGRGKSPLLHSQEGGSHRQSGRGKSPLLHSQEGGSHPSCTVRKGEVTPLTQSGKWKSPL
jgi:hypothetical protein